jgi:dTMP kinase
MSGVLVAIEGIDRAGTTTQAGILAEKLQAMGVTVHLTRQPSDGVLGAILRGILTGALEPMDQTTLALLFAADRADHLQCEVEPALARGEMVISDRWYHSSLAYQGRGDKWAWVRQINRHARTPNLTLFLDVPAVIAVGRRRSEPEEIFDSLTEQREIAVGYRDTVALLEHDESIQVVDGTRSIEEVSEAILAEVVSLCRLAGTLPELAKPAYPGSPGWVMPSDERRARGLL